MKKYLNTSITSFKCANCGAEVPLNKRIGTSYRNHCPNCLWSLHVDWKKSGDRARECRGLMKPVGLTFKQEGVDKYGVKRIGEIMLVHDCQECGGISINRLAADDQEKQVLKVYEESLAMSADLKAKIQGQSITVLTEEDRPEIGKQLFGLIPR